MSGLLEGNPDFRLPGTQDSAVHSQVSGLLPEQPPSRVSLPQVRAGQLPPQVTHSLLRCFEK